MKGIYLPAAKNVGPTIVTDFWYRQEVSRLLGDDLFYKRVDFVPFVAMNRTLMLREVQLLYWRQA